MNNLERIREGMTVYDADNQPYGTIDRVSDNGVVVNGQQLPVSMISRVDQNGVYLSGNQYGQTTDANAYRVPVAEEQLQVGKRETQAGAVRVHKEVINEQQSVPVELRREDADIQKIDTPDRPVREGDQVFQEQTFEVPLRAEEAVVSKQAVVTGEVAINKNQQVEQRQVADTVRKERVVVDRDTTATPATNTTGNYTNSTLNQNYGGNYQANTNSFTNDGAYASNATINSGTNQAGLSQVQEGLTVLGSDQDAIGTIKQVNGNELLVDRRMQRDIFVPFDAVQQVSQDGVVLNVPSDQVDNMGWRNPPL